MQQTLYADTMTEDFWAPFARLRHGSLVALTEVVLDRNVDQHARHAVVSGIVAMHHYDRKSARKGEAIAALLATNRAARRGYEESVEEQAVCQDDTPSSGYTDVAGQSAGGRPAIRSCPSPAGTCLLLTSTHTSTTPPDPRSPPSARGRTRR